MVWLGRTLTDCQNWLSKTPKTITSLNDGLSTLQFQSLSSSAKSPKDIQGGTQDNGTQATTNGKKWSVTIFGDGGQSGINVANPKIRMHTFFSPNGDVNFNGNDELGWDFMAGPLLGSGEGASFYVPLIADPNPAAANTWFVGLQHVWRTQDNAGSQAQLDTQCNEFFGTGPFDTTCGDWEPLGGSAGDLSGTVPWGADKNPGPTGYVVATERAPSDTSTLWAGLRRGRVFVSKNADNPTASAVTYDRIDSASTPERFVSGIAVDPTNPNHAFISFSGYNAYANAAGTAPGHVFDVTVRPDRPYRDLEEHRLRPRRPADHRRRPRHERRPLRVDRLRCRRPLERDDGVGSGLDGPPVRGGLRTDDRQDEQGPARGHARPQCLAARAELAGCAGVGRLVTVPAHPVRATLQGVRRVAVLLTLLAASAVPAAAAAPPALRAVTMEPLAVHGVRFRPAERITVRVAAAGSVRVHLVRATSTGSFTTTFTAVALERCAPYFVTARGSRGSVATLRRSPFQDCSPLRSPPRPPAVAGAGSQLTPR